MKNIKKIIFFIVVQTFFFIPFFYAQNKEFTRKEIEWIGNLIFQNECAGKNEYLVTWNKGEEFMSLGIGHFIWYPTGKRGIFEEGFPLLLEYLKKEKVEIPEWLSKNSTCPWQTREEFFEKIESKEVKELQSLLLSTKAEQAEFIVERLNSALPELLKSTRREKKEKVSMLFKKMIERPASTYVIIDYINFKGLGTSLKERYNGQGWGLLQILENMEDAEAENSLILSFVESAELVLEKRVRNAPVERGEERWLKGWTNRVRGYLLVEKTKL
jgi:hypothetical protein